MAQTVTENWDQKKVWNVKIWRFQALIALFYRRQKIVTDE